MVSREAGIGFLLGALAGVGAAAVWASRKDTVAILGSLRKTSEIVEGRVRTLDRFVDEVTDMARGQAREFRQVSANTTRRLDELTDTAQKSLLQSILELALAIRSLKSGLDRIRSGRAA